MVQLWWRIKCEMQIVEALEGNLPLEVVWDHKNDKHFLQGPMIKKDTWVFTLELMLFVILFVKLIMHNNVYEVFTNENNS